MPLSRIAHARLTAAAAALVIDRRNGYKRGASFFASPATPSLPFTRTRCRVKRPSSGDAKP
jgi:hypothetical protein